MWSKPPRDLHYLQRVVLPMRLGPALTRLMLLPVSAQWISYDGYEPEVLTSAHYIKPGSVFSSRRSEDCCLHKSLQAGHIEPELEEPHGKQLAK